MLTLNKPNPILSADSENFKRLVHAISACKYEDSDTIDFDGFLKIKYFFIDCQATEEEMEDIKNYNEELYIKFWGKEENSMVFNGI